MHILETLIIGIGLSMDALAASMALAAAECRGFTAGKVFATAFSFGLFQAFMPAIGWKCGALVGEQAQRFGGLAAFLLLAALGAKMLWEAAGGRQEGSGAFSVARLLSLSLATSVDALLVGVGYSCLGRTSILGDVLLIGCTTFLISFLGCLAGRAGGWLAGNKCQALGGIMLIAIGIKILVFG